MKLEIGKYYYLNVDENFIYYFEKPWKWSEERQQLIERGELNE